MTPSNQYSARRWKILIGSGGLVLSGAAFWLLSALPIDHVYGSVTLALGVLGLLFHVLRPPLQLRIEPGGLAVSGRLVPWAEVDVSELKERLRRSLRYPTFELMVKDPARESGRRTHEIREPEWARFDELYEALRDHARAARAASQSSASR